MELKYAYGYVRVSTDRQEELSPDSQERLLRDYATKNNIVILKIFFELGISDLLLVTGTVNDNLFGCFLFFSMLVCFVKDTLMLYFPYRR